MMQIKIGKGLFCLVDDDDFEALSQYKWYAFWNKGSKQFYAYSNIKSEIGKFVFTQMHRIIIKAKKGEITDHINHNSLDNRKENLRICSAGDNQKNRKLSLSSKSGFTGVTWHKNKNKWQAVVCHENKDYHLGYFKELQDAIDVRKQANIKYGFHENHGKEYKE